MSHYNLYVFHDKAKSIDDILAPFDKNLKVPKYIEFTKEQAVAKVRKEIEECKNGPYAEYLKNPEEFKKINHQRYIEFLRDEFPLVLNWTDEECYRREAKLYEGDGTDNDPRMIDEDGNLLSAYNPKSKWDYWSIGGRWSGSIPLKNGGKSVDEALVNEVEWEAEYNVPYAFITPDGEWVERGRFGVAGNEIDAGTWGEQFRKYVKSIDGNLVVTSVDYHI